MNPMEAARALSLLKFYPSDPGGREAVMNLLERIADHPERLSWLVETLLNYVGEWPGPAQLRALYATRYPPADGIEGPHCEIAGFTPQDSERVALEGHENLKRKELSTTQAVPLKRLA